MQENGYWNGVRVNSNGECAEAEQGRKERGRAAN